MRFEELTVTWKYSLSLLAWKELKLLLLVSLNNFRRALKLTATHFVWLWRLWLALLILPAFLMAFFIHNVPNNPPLALFSFGAFLINESILAIPIYSLVTWLTLPINRLLIQGSVLTFSLVYFFITFSYYLSTRASVEAKDFSYYRRYAPKIFTFSITKALVNLGLSLTLSIPIFLIRLIAPTSSHLLLYLIAAFLIFSTSALPLLVGFVLFDVENIFSTIAKGVKLFIHFFPVFFFMSIVNFLILALLYGIAMLFFLLAPTLLVMTCLNFVLSAIQSLIVNLFILSFCATLYIKIKHAHPNLFFA